MHGACGHWGHSPLITSEYTKPHSVPRTLPRQSPNCHILHLHENKSEQLCYATAGLSLSSPPAVIHHLESMASANSCQGDDKVLLLPAVTLMPSHRLLCASCLLLFPQFTRYGGTKGPRAGRTPRLSELFMAPVSLVSDTGEQIHRCQFIFSYREV